MKTLLALVLIFTALGVAALGVVNSGALNFAADEPHSRWMFGVIETLREQSIAARTRNIAVPDLADPARIALGAQHYADMCVGCHLAPGMRDTELRAGLYPQPPRFTAGSIDTTPLRSPGDAKSAAARRFWIVKHGIKGSGMPAWGRTHDDESLWGLVAFVQQLPRLSPAEYERLTRGPEAAEHAHVDEPVPEPGAEPAATPAPGHPHAQGAHAH